MSFLLRKLMAQNGYMNEVNDDTGSGGSAGGSGGAGGGAGAGNGGEGDQGDQGDQDDQSDGKPTDAEAKLLKEVMDKKTKIKSIEQDNKRLKEELKKFEGIDLTQVQALLNEKKSAETKKLEEKGEWDRLRAQMVEENTRVVNEVTTKLATAETEVKRLSGVIGELTVGNAFNSSSFIKEEVVIPVSKVRVLYGSHFEFQDGSVVAYDKPAGASERTMLVDAKGDPLTFEAALKKIVDADPDRDQLLKSKMKSGSGSNTKPGAKAPAQKLDAPSGVDRIAGALAKGILQK